MFCVPKISVVTPSFNQGKYLETTIRSVLGQNYPNLEYIIIDGGSTDISPQIIHKYAKHLAYSCSEPDEGQSDAIAKGFEHATGDILCWLGSDDIYLPGALFRVAEYFNRHLDIAVLSGACAFIDAEGAPLKTQLLNFSLGVAATYQRFRYYEQDGVCQPATFWRRQIYEAAGGMDRSRQFIMDLDLFARMAKLGRFGHLPEFLACFRLHEESKSSTIQEVRRKEFADFAQAHKRYAYGQLYAKLMYWRYRLPALSRKSLWYCLNQMGWIRCPSLQHSPWTAPGGYPLPTFATPPCSSSPAPPKPSSVSLT